MTDFKISRLPNGRWSVAIPYRGTELLAQPMFNKGSAFTVDERIAFGLEGLLPQTVSSMEQQVDRVHGHICRKSDALERYIGLMSLQDRNEHLFYKLLLENLEEFLPIVYTPTVGQASKKFSHIFRRGRGLWITPDHRGRMIDVLRNSPYRDVRLAVVTDNQAILGIGDQGAGGIAISIGKLSIYCAAAGVHPSQVLPISLDVGTNNPGLCDDPLYLGRRRSRLEGDEYAEFVAEFVEAMLEVFPDALLQWEDFSKNNAFELLERYRSRILSFNDDIQGTGAMTLAGLMAACRVSGTRLRDQRILIAGGGAAGVGIAAQVQAALREEGLSGADLERSIGVFDSRGLISRGRERVQAYQEPFAWSSASLEEAGLEPGADLSTVATKNAATVLIGTSGQPGLFSEELVRSVAGRVERPIIFPLSNPTSHAEAVPEDLVRWSDGRVLMGTGSPFEPVEWDGKRIHIGQGNNAFIFPGVGLGALTARATEITPGMFTASARALADSVSDEELERLQLYPAVSRLRQVTLAVATAVAEAAGAEGVGRAFADGELEEALADGVWNPEYPQLVPST